MTETQTTQTVPTDASANGQPAPKTPTPPKRTASRATRAAAKAQPAKAAPKQAANGKAQPADKASRPATKPAPKAAAAKAAANGSQRNAKRELATRVVLAVAAMVEALTAEQLGVDGNKAKAITAARAEAATMVSTWIHHIPADREQWVKALPKPDRSDWR